MRTLTNTKEIVVKVSEVEFQAALAAYMENMNAECPGEYDFDETHELTKAYWGIGEKPEFKELVAVKPTIMNRVKAFFA